MSALQSSSAPAPAIATLPTQPANQFSLSGGGLHVDYASTSLDGQPRLTFHDHVRTLNFSGTEIRSVELPDLGTIVSVTLSITVDVGSTTLSLLVPRVNVAGNGGTIVVATDAIITVHKTPFAPHLPGQVDNYHVTRLSGTGSFAYF
jgi:hypothetical protein